MRRFVSVFVPCVLFASAASADPQMLGVVATPAPVLLQCSDGACVAELTSICLHEKRPTPIAGHPYNAHNPDALRVTGIRADGSEVTLDVARTVRFAAARGFATVRVSVPDEVRTAHGLAAIKLDVNTPMTLVPGGNRPGSAARLTDADIAVGAGPLRATAAAIVDADSDTMHASQALARMIDRLPRYGKAPAETRTGIWRTAVVPDQQLLSKPGLHRARATYNRCYRQTRIGDRTLRTCLAEAHDDFVRDLNTRYWDAVKSGS